MKMIPALPSGTVTFLFTDIEGSTQLLQRLRDDYPRVLAEHHRLLRQAIAAHGGLVVDTQGDSFFAAFSRATGAIHAAVDAQRGLAEYPFPQGAKVRVRMGLHTGEPTIAGDRYIGMDVHRAARISSAGHGGQVLLSQTTRDLVESELPEGVTLRDLGEHQLKDLPTPNRLCQLVITGLAAEFPPLRTLDVVPNNLPAQLTSFIGREKEIREIKELLERTRLLTLTGSGGNGKTRLSLEVASDVLDLQRFKNGIWFVELAPLSDPALVPQMVATMLGVREEPGRPVIDSLTGHLKDKALLLILDNCEQVIEACATLADTLLRACPPLKILATSREALGIAGETPYRVLPLAVPITRSVSPDSILQYEAVRLFIERALTIQPHFGVTNQNAPAVAQICYRLDGIPLAIELAAARVKVLSVEQISQKLDDRFGLLTGGSRTARLRQQTLRAAIDWSHDLLPESERVLLRGVSVFAGSWTLEAAESVCASGAIRSDEILDLLMHLVDKSLVLADEQRGIARYRMLETIRQYAAEKLFESGEKALLWERHLEYFCQFAEHAEPGLNSAEQAEWVDRVELEHDNIHAALERSKSIEGGSDWGLRLAGALFWFWEQRSYLQEGRASLAALLARSSDLQSPARANALTAAAHLTFRQGDYAEAKELGEASLKIFRGIGDKRRIAIVLNTLGNIGTELGDYESTPAMFKEAVALSTEVNDKRWAVLALLGLGYAELRSGDSDAAAAHFTHALAFSREMGDKYVIGFELAALGEVAVRRGDYERATSFLEESLELRRQLEHTWGVGVCLGTLGWVAMHQGDWIKAKARLGESLEVRQEIGDQGGSAWCLERLAEVRESLGELEQAVRIFGTASALRESIGSKMDPVDQPEYDRRLTALRDTLGAEAYEVAWADGYAQTMKQALSSALSDKD